jgi:DNA invertase Pin-like site-specific DNA recombinase
MNTAAIYARVSSTGDRQDYTRQVEDLTAYAQRNGLEVVKTFTEKASGAKSRQERPVLNECLLYCVAQHIDMLLISELSRLGRNVDDILQNVIFCKNARLNIYFQKEGFSIYDKDDKENPFATIMCAVLGTCAQLERDAIYFRLSSGRKVYVAKHLKETGKTGLGRKIGYKKPREVYEEAYKDVIKLLRRGYPIRQTAKLADVSESTVKKVKAMFGL